MRDLAGHAASSVASFISFRSPMTERVVLGFDFGTRRIGIAIGNSVTGRARALTTIDAVANASRWRELGALVAQWEPAQFVVGIPRHPDGAAHALTERAERFARQLEGRFARPVARVDERYTSAVSERETDVDAAAAALILQQWFDEGGGHA
jgi:putative pre-16S rRNA nuclease